MPSSKPTQLDLVSLPTLCKTISLPGDYPPVRLPTYPAIERTSVLPFNATLTTTVPSNGLRGMLIKSSTMPLWTDAVAPAPISWTLGWNSAVPVGTPPAVSNIYPLSPEARFFASGVLNDNAIGLKVVGASVPPGGYPIVGELNSFPYVYFPRGASVTVVAFGSAVPASGASMEVEYVDLGGVVTTATIALNAPNVGTAGYKGYLKTFPLTFSAFMRPLSISYNDSWYCSNVSVTVANAVPAVTNDAGNLSLNYTGQAVVPLLIPAVKPPALDISAIPFSNTRVTALSALFTNVTKVLNKEGTVMAGRFNPTTMDVLDVTMSDYSQLAPCEKYFFGLEKGFYTYMPLQTDVAEFADDVWDLPSVTSASTRTPWLHLGRTALISTFRFDDPDGGTSLAVNLDWHVEYRNSSVLWPVAVSALSLEEAHRAQLVCLEAGFFFDNVDHKFILSMVSKGLGMVAPLLKTRAPAIASAGMAARGYIRSYLGETSHPKPSSLQTTVDSRPRVRKPKDKKVKVAPRKKSDKKKKK